ncbi:MAG: type III-B CRISPR-associated protein Cas10/Cmr2 [Planctomycetota bacterium]
MMQHESPQAFLAFWLGPVQPFIAGARTVRDLWTGSHLLAWLTRQAMAPVLARYGPRSFVSPDMTRDPMAEEEARAACLPNRFVAEVAAGDAATLAQSCRDACLGAWRELACAVRETLGEQVSEHLPEWRDAWQDSVSRLWDLQVESFLELRTTVLPWPDCSPATLQRLVGPPRASAGRSPADAQWTQRFEVLTALQASQKCIRRVASYQPPADARGHHAAKCSLLGTYEHLGPADLDEAARFWESLARKVSLAGTRVHRGERLCAVSLANRFAWEAHLARGHPEHPRSLACDDTATVAAEAWLVQRRDLHDYSRAQRESHWLHWLRPDQESNAGKPAVPDGIWRSLIREREREPPPDHYAILMLDGDHMGDHLIADVGPEHSRLISRALYDYATVQVPSVVAAHHGTLIYSGGDDALVLLPASTSLACAAALSVAVRKAWETHGLPRAEQATVSAGLAVVHRQEDLRLALDAARNALRDAKNQGRNALVVNVCRRSGEPTSSLCPWPFAATVNDWIGAFLSRDGKAPASDRWAFHLHAELSTLTALPLEGMKAEIRRRVDRTQGTARLRLGKTTSSSAGQVLERAFEHYHQLVTSPPRAFDDALSLTHFLMLCQSASFLARGKDR